MPMNKIPDPKLQTSTQAEHKAAHAPPASTLPELSNRGPLTPRESPFLELTLPAVAVTEGSAGQVSQD